MAKSYTRVKSFVAETFMGAGTFPPAVLPPIEMKQLPADESPVYESRRRERFSPQKQLRAGACGALAPPSQVRRTRGLGRAGRAGPGSLCPSQLASAWRHEMRAQVARPYNGRRLGEVMGSPLDGAEKRAEFVALLRDLQREVETARALCRDRFRGQRDCAHLVEETEKLYFSVFGPLWEACKQLFFSGDKEYFATSEAQERMRAAVAGIRLESAVATGKEKIPPAASLSERQRSFFYDALQALITATTTHEPGRQLDYLSQAQALCHGKEERVAPADLSVDAFLPGYSALVAQVAEKLPLSALEVYLENLLKHKIKGAEGHIIFTLAGVLELARRDAKVGNAPAAPAERPS